MYLKIIQIIFISMLNSAEISDYFGIWKGYSEGNAIYDIYIKFPGIMKNNNDKSMAGKYEISLREKIKYKNSNTFNVMATKETNCYNATIYYDILKNKDKMFTEKTELHAEACVSDNDMNIKFLNTTGKAWFYDKEKKNIIVFEFDNGLKGRIERKIIRTKTRKKSSNMKPEILKPVEKENSKL
jgi:hypothetical protein